MGYLYLITFSVQPKVSDLQHGGKTENLKPNSSTKVTVYKNEGILTQNT